MRGRAIAMGVGVVGLVTVVVTAGGCAREGRDDWRMAAARPSASLMFDCVPGFPDGTAVGRSDWPSTPGKYDAGELSFFREYLYDFQGTYPSYQNYYNRRFEAYRVGTLYR